jgi:hypothetical protein
MKSGTTLMSLASYLTVIFEDYTREEVQETLQSLFEQQYELTLEKKWKSAHGQKPEPAHEPTLTRKPVRTWEEEYEYEVEVEYEYYILNVTLRNYGLGNVIRSAG